jgi:hypothetical protein
MVAIVGIDNPEGGVASLAQKATHWLLEEGVVQPNSKRDELWQPSEWMPGSRWREVVNEGPWNEYFMTLANNGVDVDLKRQLHHPVENYESPVCLRCGAVLSEDVHHAMIEPWLAGDEPIVVCPKCGWSAPIGDWPAEFGFAIGAPAIVFNNWPMFKEAFLLELRALLGGRTLVVRTHM